jgi:hypothetical protein
MKTYTDKQIDELIDKAINKASITPIISNKELLILFYWSLFNKRKLYKLCEGLERGKHWYFSFNDAKKYKNEDS